MKTLLTTTALALALTGPAVVYAESHVSADDSQQQAMGLGEQLDALGVRATDLIGKRLYMQVSDDMAEGDEMAEGDTDMAAADAEAEASAEGDATAEADAEAEAEGDAAMETEMAEGDAAEAAEEQEADAEMAEADAAEAEEEQEAEMAETEVGEAAEEVEAEVAEAGENLEAAGEEVEAEVAEAGENIEGAAEEAGEEVAEAGEAAENAGNEMMAEVEQIQDDWQSVGDINDLVVSQDGEIRAIIVDAGGFLGMGETQKRIDMADLRFVADSDDEGEFYVVYTGDRATFEEQTSYDAENASAQNEMLATENEEMAGQMGGGMSYAGENQQAVEWSNVSTEELLGSRVYSTDDEWVGDLSELILSDDGQIQGAIIDVGGFLGIGEKPVQLSMEQVELRGTDAENFRVYVSATQDELDNMERYED